MAATLENATPSSETKPAPHEGGRGRALAVRTEAALAGVSRSAWFAYGSIVLIQAKVLWKMWDYRDLVAGDTAAYFSHGKGWSEHLQVTPAWSPLYHVFFGSMQWLITDTYAVAIAHRIVIAIGVSLLVLAVLRRLLPSEIAWGLAVWWAVLPINYDTLYEVYLFGVVPLAVAILVASRWVGPHGRAAVLAILALGGALVRVELFVAAAVWGAIWLAYELRKRARLAPELRIEPRRLALYFAIPVLLVLVAYGGLALRSRTHNSPIADLQQRESGTVCQDYALGYVQRHDDFSGEPASQDCERLASRDLGNPKPSLSQAFTANPAAMTEFVLWNLRLLPYGVELATFNATSGDEEHNPDFIAVKTGSSLALFGSISIVVIVGLGCFLLWRERRRWWDSWLRDRAWGWSVLVAAALAALPTMVLIRPRPAYFYGWTLFLFALVGLCLLVIGARRPGLARLRAVLPLVAVALVAAVPSHYQRGYATPQTGSGEAVRETIDRLQPYATELSGRSVELAAMRFSGAVCTYVAGPNECHTIDLSLEIRNAVPGTSLLTLLDRTGATYLYADQDMTRNPGFPRALRQLHRAGWERVGPARPEPWVLLRRIGPRTNSEAISG